MPLAVWRTFYLSFKSWDDRIVVFNHASGSTHLINPVTAKILLALQDQPCSVIEIARQMTADVELDTDEEIVQRVEAVLETLDDLGLVELLS